MCVSYEPRNGQIKICLCWTLESPRQSQGDEIEINRIEHQSISLLFWLFVFFFFSPCELSSAASLLAALALLMPTWVCSGSKQRSKEQDLCVLLKGKRTGRFRPAVYVAEVDKSHSFLFLHQLQNSLEAQPAFRAQLSLPAPCCPWSAQNRRGALILMGCSGSTHAIHLSRKTCPASASDSFRSERLTQFSQAALRHSERQALNIPR